MAPGLIALGDNRVNPVIFKPFGFFDRGRRRQDEGAGRLDAGQQSRRRQAEMEADHRWARVFDGLAHLVVERQAQGKGCQGIRGQPKFAIIGLQQGAPSLFAGRVVYFNRMAEEVEIE